MKWKSRKVKRRTLRYIACSRKLRCRPSGKLNVEGVYLLATYLAHNQGRIIGTKSHPRVFNPVDVLQTDYALQLFITDS